jgi:hypothetical protein
LRLGALVAKKIGQKKYRAMLRHDCSEKTIKKLRKLSLNVIREYRMIEYDLRSGVLQFKLWPLFVPGIFDEAFQYI